jgi:ribosomal protein S18 acetylase RimI-like enzyme
MLLRRFVASDTGRVWALSNITNIGETADPGAPLDLPIPGEPPAAFPFLADVERHFLDNHGEFLVVERDAHFVGMGGIRPNNTTQAEVKHVRIHPATRRLGVGRLLMDGLEDRARDLGYRQLYLDTATNQPEAVAFYRALGYAEDGTESDPSWNWTLQYFIKSL